MPFDGRSWQLMISNGSVIIRTNILCQQLQDSPLGCLFDDKNLNHINIDVYGKDD